MFSLYLGITSSIVAQNLYQFLGSQCISENWPGNRIILYKNFKNLDWCFVRKTFSFRITQKSEDKSNAFVKILINGIKIVKIWTFQSKFFKVS